METRASLPDHAVPDRVVAQGRTGLLRVHGLVEQPLTLTEETLSQLPRVELEAPFTCEEGWTVPGLRWAGIRLADVLALARPLPSAGFVRVGSGEFVLPLPLADAVSALLCNRLNGGPLTVAHGAPWRLIAPGAACYASVKWVDRLELVGEPGVNTAQTIARGRLRNC